MPCHGWQVNYRIPTSPDDESQLIRHGFGTRPCSSTSSGWSLRHQKSRYGLSELVALRGIVHQSHNALEIGQKPGAFVRLG